MKIALSAAGFMLSNVLFGQLHFRDFQKIDIRQEMGDSLMGRSLQAGDLDDIQFNIHWSQNGDAVITAPNPASMSVESIPFRDDPFGEVVDSVTIRVLNVDHGQALLLLDCKRVDPRGRKVVATPFAWKVALRSSPGKLLKPTSRNLTPLSHAVQTDEQSEVVD